jgi:2-polyprenyl-3-methyl-5-hydroxy-6-metoxy-1,4-benzoquinol methylase
MSDPFKYTGEELELFQHAKHWKQYFSRQILPRIKGSVLEVGAGIGATTLLLNNGTAEKWLLLEPDENMSRELKMKIDQSKFPQNCQVQTGYISQVKTSFDTIIYIDVLEHIKDDRQEIENAAMLLNPGGHIIILGPAFQFLYNPFDKAIGHYRRYNKRMLQSIMPANFQLLSNRYYDSIGFFASLINKLFLRKKYPTQKQVLFWDNWMIPVSRVTDKLFFYSFGKSIIGIWKNPG